MSLIFGSSCEPKDWFKKVPYHYSKNNTSEEAVNMRCDTKKSSLDLAGFRIETLSSVENHQDQKFIS